MGPCQGSALDLILTNLAQFPCRVFLQQIQEWVSSGGVGLQDCQSDILCLKGNKITAIS